jgi:hypothetical protein
MLGGCSVPGNESCQTRGRVTVAERETTSEKGPKHELLDFNYSRRRATRRCVVRVQKGRPWRLV